MFKKMVVFVKRPQWIIIAVLTLVIITKKCNAKSDDEGSGDVCNVDGSTCPEDKCCREAACQKDGGELTCCPDPSSDPTCANCPKCGKNYEILV